MRVIAAFLLAFILCFMLTDKLVLFTGEQETTMQLVEPFIWTFGDGNSILLPSLRDSGIYDMVLVIMLILLNLYSIRTYHFVFDGTGER